jgi:hypothetical protein
MAYPDADEINDLMDEHALSFGDSVEFLKESVLDFARAIRVCAGLSDQEMTDEEIIDIMDKHALTFSHYAYFSFQGVFDFADAICDYKPDVAHTKTSSYTDVLRAFLEDFDRFIGLHK